jgi:hypothetical protein
VFISSYTAASSEGVGARTVFAVPPKELSQYFLFLFSFSRLIILPSSSAESYTCLYMSPVQKAGVLYLTLVEAYERCRMLQKEHAPDLLLAHNGKDYEVRYHFLLQRYGETH